MKVLQQILKIIGGLLIGVGAGLVIAAVGVVVFTDTTLSGFISNLMETDLSEAIGAIMVGVASLFVSVPVLVIIHEAGHLVSGLLSGYSFVSFRVFNLTFIRQDGVLRIKRYSIAGTGGQCLLCPPDRPLDKIPTAWYNIGGVVANVVVFLAVLPLMWMPLSAFAKEGVSIFLLIDLIMICLNGIPMQAGGIGNDAYNMLMLRSNMTAKRGFISQLRSNALIQAGVRPKDMPDEWFGAAGDVNFQNPLEAAVVIMDASRLVDMERWEEARRVFNEIYSHKDELMAIYVKEVECELVFLSLVMGRVDEAKVMLTPKLMEYISQYRQMMSSKERTMAAIEYHINGDRDKSKAIYDSLEQQRDRYLLAGEVDSDLALMRATHLNG